MPNDYFEFSKFTVKQSGCSQKVSTDACIFGAWVAANLSPRKKVLDVGAGTGLLMLMIAQRHEVLIDGVEIDDLCAFQLKENLESSSWSKRLQGVHEDIKNFAPGKAYDLIVSNPPFYEKQLRSPDTSKNLAWHSSELTLRSLATIAANLLSQEGRFAIIIPFARQEEAIAEAAENGLFPENILTVRHTLNHPFSRSLIVFSFSKNLCDEKTLEIKDAGGSYTDEFVYLMKEYYLFL